MKLSDNPSPSLLFLEHVDPANPSAGYQRLFVDTDHIMKMIDSAGTVTPLASSAGSVATDAIWDAAGDLAVGTGADTAAKLTKGAAGTVPTAGASTLAYAFPPGHEFDYVEKTSSTAISATSEGAANTVVTGNAVTYDGSTAIMVEFYAPQVDTGWASSDSIIFVLYDGSSSIGLWGYVSAPGHTGGVESSIYLTRRLTPSAAAHTYSVRAWRANENGTVDGGAGGAGSNMPAFIRQVKV